MTIISIIGTGRMAASIGKLAVGAGHEVEIMGRDPAKAEALANNLGGPTVVGRFGAEPRGAIVVLAVPYTAVLDLVRHYGEALSGKLLLDITNPIKDDFSRFLTPAGTSGAEEIAGLAPTSAVVVKAFNTLNARILAGARDRAEPLDTFLAGDDAAAKSRVSTLVESLGLRPLDAGPLSMAGTLEHACMLVLGLVTHSFGHGSFALGIQTRG